MRTQKILWVDPDETAGWRLGIQRLDNTVEFGLYWRDKPYPTHTFTVSRSDWEHIKEELKDG